ncbi:nuclear transport factor 2 family protein [Aestuariibaculum sp. YM273]|uniref:nuclear transport factor 2 family protein n=1 Tax=Aestuariibaculum sp. YM273 TaxID=3070659 RepID=UPI0027DB2000|nr:nuclear transport factor 2 family protein [Aestuariibaculum sp. YM273]WMI65019.1 nuclear transport factor 2 family protein [Aestuariibaculum sp. YM273]
MKNLFLLLLALSVLTACNDKPQRYFETSQEIDILKSGIKAYETQDWTAWRANFADTAKIHHNTIKGLSPEDNIANLQSMVANFASYGFQDKGSFSEMVIDKDAETWVNYWGIWNGVVMASGEKVTVPVHLTARFIGDKIVEEYVYYDSAPISKALEAAEAMSDSEAPAEEVEMANE